MTTTRGSYDFKAVKQAHDDAEQVATNYVTDISNGIMVHPENDTDNAVNITDGVYIKVDNNIVAKYKEYIEVGSNDGSHILIDNDSIDFYVSQSDIIGYINQSKAFFPVLESQTLYTANNFVWRQTPNGNLGLYLR